LGFGFGFGIKLYPKPAREKEGKCGRTTERKPLFESCLIFSEETEKSTKRLTTSIIY